MSTPLPSSNSHHRPKVGGSPQREKAGAYRAGAIATFSYAGRQEEARTLVEQLVASRFVDLRQDHWFVFGLAMLAMACLQLNAREPVSIIYETLIRHGP